MGERCDNFSHAFNGMALDWSRVLGSRFEDAPKTWVSVFREASLEELLYIAREGLTSYHQDIRHPDLLQEMEVLDSFRPKKVVEQGISRLDAITALPVQEGEFGHYHRRAVTLEMKVDPKCCYVGDTDYLHYAIPHGAKKPGGERFRSAFTKYWDSMTPLSSFLKHYSRVDMPEGFHWLKKDGAPRGLPDLFFAPEVLMMTPAVSSQYIRVASSPQFAGSFDEYEEGWEE